MVKISLVVSEEQKTELQQKAKANGVSLNKYILSFVYPAEGDSQTKQDNQSSSIDTDKILAAIEDLKKFDNSKEIEQYILNINQTVSKLIDFKNSIDKIGKMCSMVDRNSRIVLNRILVKILNTVPFETSEGYYKNAFSDKYCVEYDLPDYYDQWTPEHNQLFKQYLDDRYRANKKTADELIPLPKD